MKKLLSLFLVLTLAVIGADAQVQTGAIVKGNTSLISDSNAGVIDSVTNTGTKTQSIFLPTYYDNVSVQVDVTRLSGTLGGTLKLQTSLNGTNYYDVSSASLSVSNVASQSIIWDLTPYKHNYIRTTWTGTGTMLGKFSTLVTYSRKP